MNDYRRMTRWGSGTAHSPYSRNKMPPANQTSLTLIAIPEALPETLPPEKVRPPGGGPVHLLPGPPGVE